MIVGFLIFVLVAGIVAVKSFQTTRGMVFLVDAGFTEYFDRVQEDLDPGLRSVMRTFGLIDDLKERIEPVRAGKKRLDSRVWETRCKAACSFVKINLALTKTVRRAGAVVRAGAERDGGTVLVFNVGTRKYTTHRIIVRQGEAAGHTKRTPAGIPRLALVIDDFGFTKGKIVEDFLLMDLPLTVSVIPAQPYSLYVARRAVEMRKEVVLHLPMEPEEENTQDVVAVMTGMQDEEINDLVERWVNENPWIEGVNNHMGSKATQDRRVMEAVLKVLKRHDLFFLDSLTSRKSVAYNTAKTLGVPTVRNDIFLDADTRDPAVVEERLHRLLDIARERGYAVGIGHPKGWTFEAIRNNITVLKNSDVQLVFVSELVE